MGLSFGLGVYSGIVPKEVADAGAGNWKNVNGTGPFQLAEFVQGNSNTYVKNPVYWGTEKINGVETKLPLVDKLVFRTIKDEATYLTALRTAKLGILETIRWSAVEELKMNAPQLRWSKWLNMSGTFLSMRVDTKPFDDIRVRRALNLALNKQEIVKEYYGGNAELFADPQHPRLSRLLRAARGHAGLGQGALHLQSRQSQETARRGRRAEGIYL